MQQIGGGLARFSATNWRQGLWWVRVRPNQDLMTKYWLRVSVLVTLFQAKADVTQRIGLLEAD